MEISLRFELGAVLGRVAQTSAYTGAKMEEDSGAYERISTVDEDEGVLMRHFDECRSELCQKLIGLVVDEGVQGEDYVLRLDVSNSFDASLLPSMEVSLEGYFVLGVCAKWYVYTNKKEAGDYALKAASMLEDLHRKAVHKRKPVRPSYS